MLPTLTPAVTRALTDAARYARARGAESVEPADLLLGLLEEEDGRPCALAVAAGLDLSAFQSSRGPRADVGDLPLSRAAEGILFAARELAAELPGEQSALTSEPVFLAAVRGSPDSAAQLGRLGLRVARLEEMLLATRPPLAVLDEPLQLADLTERSDIARVLDASLNRAREALRVLEDYCRFVLEDAFLSGELKHLRHELARVVDEHGPPGLLSARETQHDPGVSITTADERQRGSLLDVARVNLKRLQEAFRSVAEFAKVPTPLLAECVESLRYRSYTLERAIVLGTGARRRLADVRLYVLLSSKSCSAALEWTIAEAAAGGANIVQLREKELTDRALLARACDVRRWCEKAGVMFLLNDRPDIARLAGADGVHLGQDDLSVKDARRLLGPDAIIGVSTHELAQVRQAVLDGADYIGVGPVFSSRTKTFATLAGLEFVRTAMAETTLPAFAIGGIHADNIESVVAAGGRRVAVSQAIASADDPRAVAAHLTSVLQQRGLKFGSSIRE